MKLLLVEDDATIRNLLRTSLEEEGHTVEAVESAEQAFELGDALAFDVYLLDVLLPGQSGHELCRWLRERGVKAPVLMLTALGGVQDKVSGLDSGADDYLTKPFELAEIKARLRALDRKAKGYPRAVMTVADLSVDPNQRTVHRGELAIELSKKEFALLECLLRGKDRLVTRSVIANSVWAAETSIYTNVIDVFINSLRKKIDLPEMPKLIHTVRGKGFTLSATPPSGNDS